MSEQREPFEQSSVQPGGLEGPAWRFERGQCLADTERAERQAEGLAGTDDSTLQVAEYLQIRRRGPAGAQAAAVKDPLVDGAIRLWENQELRQQLQVLVIADVSPAEIASRLAVEPQIVAAAEAMFFDVRSRLNARGWVSCQVIRPLVRSGAADLATQLKFAFFGGPAAARAILDARIGVPPQEAQRLFDRDLLLHVKAQAALEMPLEDGQQLEFLTLFLKYDLDQKRLELDQRKFALRCRQAEAAQEAQPRAAQGAAGDPQQQRGQPNKANQRRDVGQDLRVLGEDRSTQAIA
jgi:hypothetical protein